MSKNRITAMFLMFAALAVSASLWAEAERIEPPTKIHLKKTEPRAVATMRHTGSFEDIPTVVMELISQVEEGGYHMTWPVMAIYYSNPQEVPEQDLVWEVWVPVVYPGPIAPVENDTMGFTYLDAMFVAYTYHIGPYDEMTEAYTSLLEWAERNKYKVIGPPIELYWSDPTSVPEENLVTEIWFPVEEKKIPGIVK
jgi:AraC family transcriptional regulator